MMMMAALLLAAALGAEAGEWNFAVTLDDRPIGTHRFLVTGSPEARSVDSRAQFKVSVLGIPFYRYAHHAEEHWQGDCLRELQSDTDDDGKPQQVNQRYEAGCLMAFAYWNPRLVQQKQLVDPQTGRTEAVRFERLPDARIEVEGKPVAAQGWRLLAEKQDLTLWYATEGGRWIALDAKVKGGRRLSYRLAAP
ncbi:DUF6134 family protein [Pelomonas sp. KK5]|uniref:DUF6134 family protein n=1 Tax=Pelomonas sp. KK5 TaxID=1855730 RepID=UPI00097C7A60|nr:DUF6134 family protein [Pelomonas sp. KK5]